VGIITFACDVQRHCQFGQIVQFTVLSTAPSSSPSVSGMPSISNEPSGMPSSDTPTVKPSMASSMVPSMVPTTKSPTMLPTVEPTMKKGSNIFDHDHGLGSPSGAPSLGGREVTSDGVYCFGSVQLAFATCMAILSIHIS